MGHNVPPFINSFKFLGKRDNFRLATSRPSLNPSLLLTIWPELDDFIALVLRFLPCHDKKLKSIFVVAQCFFARLVSNNL